MSGGGEAGPPARPGRGLPGQASALSVSRLHKGFGANPVLRGIDLSVEEGSFNAILGSSGSGKTTLLRVLAGFERPEQGTVHIGRALVEDCGRTFVPPDRRRIGYVPQEGALFPHLTVAGNVGFGVRRAERASVVAKMLATVGLGDLGGRYPHQLSGGQQQRVALARALATGPQVVLLDEPFSSLDATMRATVRAEVASVLRSTSTTALLVTHDQDEALSMADSVAVLRQGRIVQRGTPQELYTAPVDAELASFLGDANLVEGTASGGMVDTALGRLDLSGAARGVSGPVMVLVRPEQILVEAGSEASGSVGAVTECEYYGHDAILWVRPTTGAGLPGRGLLVRVPGGRALAPGSPVVLRTRDAVMAWARSGGAGSADTPASD